MKHTFNTACHQYACHLQDRLNQSASSREWIDKDLSGFDQSSGAFILRGVSGDKIAQVSGKGKVTL